MIRYISTYKIQISLQYYQSLNPEQVLDYNMANYLDLLLNNNKINRGLEISNNNREETKLTNIYNDKKDIGLADINK